MEALQAIAALYKNHVAAAQQGMSVNWQELAARMAMIAEQAPEPSED